MSGTIYPSCDCTLYCINLSIIVGHIFCEASLEKWYFGTSLVEICVTYWYNAVCHGYTMFHRDVVQSLIPRERWKLMTLSKLISQIKCSDAPLFRLATPCTLCIISLSSLLIDDPLCVFQGHGARSCPRWLCLTFIVDAEMLSVSLNLCIES